MVSRTKSVDIKESIKDYVEKYEVVNSLSCLYSTDNGFQYGLGFRMKDKEGYTVSETYWLDIGSGLSEEEVIGNVKTFAKEKIIEFIEFV